MADIVERLELEGPFYTLKNRELRKHAADLIARQREEIERLQDRLEMRHAHQMIDGKMQRVTVPVGSIPDGIECRDETIRLQDARLDRQREEIGRLRKALGAFVAYHDRLAGMSVDELLLGDGTSEPELRRNGRTALSDTTREE